MYSNVDIRGNTTIGGNSAIYDGGVAWCTGKQQSGNCYLYKLPSNYAKGTHGSLVVAMSSHISYLDTIPLLATQHDPGIYVHV